LIAVPAEKLDRLRVIATSTRHASSRVRTSSANWMRGLVIQSVVHARQFDIFAMARVSTVVRSRGLRISSRTPRPSA
jgi:hypothetical protein